MNTKKQVTEQFPLPAWITLGQAARLLEKSHQAVYARIGSGALTPRMVLGTRMVPTKQVQALRDEEKRQSRKARQ